MLPALNPTSGVRGKPPLTDSLVFKKDPSRPGGGVFVAHTKPKDGEVDETLPEGTIISGDGNEGEAPADAVSGSGPSNDLAASSVSSSGYPAWSSASVAESSGQGQQRPQPQVPSQQPAEQMQQDAPMVQYPQSDGSFSNVNPVLNDPSLPGNVQVMNVLDVPQASNTLEQFAMADTAFMEGIPNSMFEWSELQGIGHWHINANNYRPLRPMGPLLRSFRTAVAPVPATPATAERRRYAKCLATSAELSATIPLSK